eukprot:1488438-Prymnesium_polylepis.1
MQLKVLSTTPHSTLSTSGNEERRMKWYAISQASGSVTMDAVQHSGQNVLTQITTSESDQAYRPLELSGSACVVIALIEDAVRLVFPILLLLIPLQSVEWPVGPAELILPDEPQLVVPPRCPVAAARRRIKRAVRGPKFAEEDWRVSNLGLEAIGEAVVQHAVARRLRGNAHQN